MDSTLKLRYNEQEYEMEYTTEQPLREIQESWYSQNIDTIPLEELDFKIGNNVYGCDDTAGLLILNEIDQFSGIIEVSKALETEDAYRAVSTEAPIQVVLQVPGKRGMTKLDMSAGQTIQDMKDELLTESDRAHEMFVFYQNNKVRDDK